MQMENWVSGLMLQVATGVTTDVFNEFVGLSNSQFIENVSKYLLLCQCY